MIDLEKESDMFQAVRRIGAELREVAGRVSSLEVSLHRHDTSLAVGEAKILHLEGSVGVLIETTGKLRGQLDDLSSEVKSIVPTLKAEFRSELSSHELKEKEAQVDVLREHIRGLKAVASYVLGRLILGLLAAWVVWQFPGAAEFVKGLL